MGCLQENKSMKTLRFESIRNRSCRSRSSPPNGLKIELSISIDRSLLVCGSIFLELFVNFFHDFVCVSSFLWDASNAFFLVSFPYSLGPEAGGLLLTSSFFCCSNHGSMLNFC